MPTAKLWSSPMTNTVTVLRARFPSRVCKRYELVNGMLNKHAIATIVHADALPKTVETTDEMVAILREVTESTDLALVCGEWHGGDKPFEVITEAGLAKLVGSEVGKMDGGVQEIEGRRVAARLKRGFEASAWTLLDADNPAGMPEAWCRLSIQERLELLEPLLPGITDCERIEVRSSSARVSADGSYGMASHAYIRLSDPNKLELLRAHVSIEMVLQGLAFQSPRYSRLEQGKIIGHAYRTVVDTAVWVPGRLIFCAKPDVRGAPGYTVGDADIRIVNAGAGPLDVSSLTQPKAHRLVDYRKETGTRLVTRAKGAALHTAEYGQLTLETEIEVKGVVKSLKAWLADVPKDGKLRCEAPFRASSSEAAFIAIGKDGLPFVHDVGTGTTHYLLSTTPQLTYQEVLAECTSLEMGDTDAISEIVTIAGSLKPVEKEAVYKEIKAITGVGLKTLRDQARSSDEVEPTDQLELAKLVHEKVGTQNLFYTQQTFWRWDGSGVWRATEDTSIKQIAQGVIAGCGLEVSASLVNGVTDVLANHLHVADHAFNRGNAESVNCLNGELELEVGGWVLKSHRRELYRTTQIPIKYSAQATAPRFLEFLEQVFRDDEDRTDKVRAILEIMGYTLMSHARHEKFVVLIGAGANGKSALLRVLEGLCGPVNVAGVQPSNFDRTFQRAHLHHKLANIVTELRQGEVLADAELKAIVSGETATVENKFKTPFTMQPYATCWFGTNHMPTTKDFSEALFRRALVITFNRVFTKPEQDPHLAGKLVAELPGILNMCLAAYGHALQAGFTEPASAVAATAEWRLEADPIAQFVEERCTRSPSSKIRSSELHGDYRLWAEQNGLRQTLSIKSFRDRLTRLGFGKRKDRDGNWVLGLSLSWGSL